MKRHIKEKVRLSEARLDKTPWRKWGPYLSERQWGTVREDYSENGDAWNYFTHEQSRSRAYHWGEDGLAGLSDEKQRLCFALALWNGKDPILKERLFGLSNGEGNHGEDVKEYYFYLDNVPTHSYMKYLYKYPQREYPYNQLVEVNGQRSRTESEYELIDTGIFNDDRYFDIFVEYAKAAPEDILIKISVHNRGAEAAHLHILPTLWFRNTWSWQPGKQKPVMSEQAQPGGTTKAVLASHSRLGDRILYLEGAPPLLFTENETNNARLFGGTNTGPYVKDGINDYVVHGRIQAVNPAQTGTKAAAHYEVDVGRGKTTVLRLRLCDKPFPAGKNPFKDFDTVMDSRLKEADDFYEAVIPDTITEEENRIMRQALAGMLWSKQYYYFDLDKWLEERSVHPLLAGARHVRNDEWFHMVNSDIISMPDKWEYPWYAAWDLAFHAIALSIVDVDFAKEQLEIMLKGIYMHPSGQLPAYEWNFSDVNPPVHAWATLFLNSIQQAIHGEVDVDFLTRSFNKLALNFAWWVNRKDRYGKNIFEGGFLGLDNIGVFDRSAPLPTGGFLEQADGTGWMALFCQNMASLGVELAAHEPAYAEMVSKFVEHFTWIAASVNRPGEGMWDEEDGFYYDVLRLPDGSSTRLKVRSLVGLLPLCATSVVEKWQRDRVPEAVAHLEARLRQMPRLSEAIHPTGQNHRGVQDRGILALVNPQKLRRILLKMLDENEFLSPYGIRALSLYHRDHPYVFSVGNSECRVAYTPAESDTAMFGGNSNWRGPVWFPMNALIIRALVEFYLYYGDNFKVECPTGSGEFMNLYQVATEISRRLTAIFLPDDRGRRPVYGGTEKFQTDPHWKDYLLFYEYFHGDNGAGLGASHQTGWTGLVAPLLDLSRRLDEKELLRVGRRSDLERVFRETEKVPV